MGVGSAGALEAKAGGLGGPNSPFASDAGAAATASGALGAGLDSVRGLATGSVKLAFRVGPSSSEAVSRDLVRAVSATRAGWGGSARGGSGSRVSPPFGAGGADLAITANSSRASLGRRSPRRRRRGRLVFFLTGADASGLASSRGANQVASNEGSLSAFARCGFGSSAQECPMSPTLNVQTNTLGPNSRAWERTRAQRPGLCEGAGKRIFRTCTVSWH